MEAILKWLAICDHSEEEKQNVINTRIAALDMQKGNENFEYFFDYIDYLLNIDGRWIPPQMSMYVMPKCRAIVMNWLLDLQRYLKLSEYTLCEAVAIVDRVVQMKRVLMKDYQLVAIASLWISVKLHEVNQQQASNLLSYSCDAFSKDKLLKYEKKILNLIQFKLIHANPAAFIDVILYSLNFPEAESLQIRHLSCYVMNLFILNAQYTETRALLLSAGCVTTAVIILFDVYYCWSLDTLPVSNDLVMEIVERALPLLIYARFGDHKAPFVKFCSNSQYRRLAEHPKLRPKRLKSILIERF